MSAKDIECVVERIVERAQRQGSLLRKEIREELERSSVRESGWSSVLTLLRPSLRYYKGRYHYVSPTIGRLRTRVSEKKQELKAVQQAVRQLIRQHVVERRKDERRKHLRILLIQPVKVYTQTSGVLNFLSQDISLSGIRLLGNCSLVRETVTMQIPRPEQNGGCLRLNATILWAAPVGDGLIQQGGVFVDLPPSVSD